MTIVSTDLCPTCERWPVAWLAIPTEPVSLRRGRTEDPHPMCGSCKAQAERYDTRMRFVTIERALTMTAAEIEAEVTQGTLDGIGTPTPYVSPNHPPTAQAMQARALPRSGTMRAEMLSIIARSPSGMTDYDLERAMHRSHQSASACRNGLMNDGFVTAALDGDGRAIERINDFGNAAQVWVATNEALRRLSGGNR